MASITTRPNGHRWIQFRRYHRRYTLRLGKCSMAAAKDVKFHVETLLVAGVSRQPLPQVTARWLGEISPTLIRKLAATGLIEGHAGPNGGIDTYERADRLGPLVDYVLRQYADVNQNTLRNIKSAADELLKAFGKYAPLESITPADAEEFRRRLLRRRLADTTVTAHCKKARRIFSMAVNKRWLRENPFAQLRGYVMTNPDRQRFVDRETIARLMARCEPDWQLIVALARFGGLRCPSEVMALKWQWVDFENQRFTVYAPKTSSFRTVPIFPELRGVLTDAFARAADGAIYVVRPTRGSSEKALYSAMRKRLERAGINAWPKLFVNMRSSRETELIEQFPIHVVTSWLGNSPSIAAQHYLQTTEEHFRKAAASDGKPPDLWRSNTPEFQKEPA